MIKFKNLNEFEDLGSDFSLSSMTSSTSLASKASPALNMYFLKKLPNRDGLIINGKKMTSTY